MNIIINSTLSSPPAQAEIIGQNGSFYSHLLMALGYSGNYIPVGDLLRQYYGLDGQWLVVSPVHWQATHNDAMIVACENDLQITKEQSQAWFEAFNDLVRAENMTAYYCDAATWLLRYDGKPMIQSKPVHDLLHRSLMPELQQLDDSHYWQRFITESQMYFSHHKLNQQRTLPVNGVWLWGAGVLHEKSPRHIICGTEQLIRLAETVSLQTTPITPYLPSKTGQSKTHAVKFPKNSILIFDEMDSQFQTYLENQLKKHTTIWYWNNTIYKLKPKRWFSGWR